MASVPPAVAVITAVPSLSTDTSPVASTLATLSFEETNAKYAGAALTVWSIPVGILKDTPSPPTGNFSPFTADSTLSSPFSMTGFR